jgi:hypothetical protein
MILQLILESLRLWTLEHHKWFSHRSSTSLLEFWKTWIIVSFLVMI